MSDSCDGDTTMPFTGRAVTTMAAVAVRPSLLVVMVVDPVETPVTSPDDDTLATAEFADE